MARKPNTTPKSAVQNLFPDIPYEGNPDNQPQATKAGAEDFEAKIAGLLGKIEALSSSVNSLQESNAALMARPQVVYAPAQIAPTQQEAAIPDPLENPDGYTQAITERILGRVDELLRTNAAQQNQHNELANASDQLWTDFSEAFPEWSEFPDEIGFVAQKVLDKAIERRVDPERYVFANRDKYFKDIEAEAKRMFGHLIVDEDGENKGAGTPYDDDTDRSGGIWGGNGAAMPTSKGANPAAKGDMIADIIKLQKDSGFH